MFLQVQYHDERYDFVPAAKLSDILQTKRVKMFFRPSEHRWVILGIDPVRGSGGFYYGPDRRNATDGVLEKELASPL